MPFAQDDMTNLTDYIAIELKAPETVLKLAKAFRNIIDNLSIFPQSHGLDEDPELKKYGIRKLFYKNYKIYFWIDETKKTVYILRVFHMLSDSNSKILKFIKERSF